MPQDHHPLLRRMQAPDIPRDQARHSILVWECIMWVLLLTSVDSLKCDLCLISLSFRGRHCEYSIWNRCWLMPGQWGNRITCKYAVRRIALCSHFNCCALSMASNKPLTINVTSKTNNLILYMVSLVCWAGLQPRNIFQYFFFWLPKTVGYRGKEKWFHLRSRDYCLSVTIRCTSSRCFYASMKGRNDPPRSLYGHSCARTVFFFLFLFGGIYLQWD